MIRRFFGIFMFGLISVASAVSASTTTTFTLNTGVTGVTTGTLSNGRQFFDSTIDLSGGTRSVSE